MVFLFLGFPSSWDKGLAILTGLIIIVFAYRIRFKEAPPKGAGFTDSAAAVPTATASVFPSAPYQKPPATPDAA